MMTANTTLSPAQGVQYSLNQFGQATNQLLHAALSSQKTPIPSIESSLVNQHTQAQYSQASIKALKTEEQMIGQLLDISA